MLKKTIFIDTKVYQFETRSLRLNPSIEYIHLSLTKPVFHNSNTFAEHKTIILTSAMPLYSRKITSMLNKSAKLFCLGENTANLAKKKGFKDISFAKQNSHKLFTLLTCLHKDNKLKFPIIYPTTKNRVFDLDSKLAKNGIQIQTYNVYKVINNNKNISVFNQILYNNDNIYIAVYSLKTAEIIIKTTKQFCLLNNCKEPNKKIQFLALSKRISSPIEKVINSTNQNNLYFRCNLIITNLNNTKILKKLINVP